MSVDIQKLSDLLSTDKKLRKHDRVLPSTVTKVDENICQELALTLSNSEMLLKDQYLLNTIYYVLWNEKWNDYGIYGPNRDNYSNNQYASRRYVRGRKVFVEFGTGNIGKETSIPHPAFILYNFAETLIVVPTTSDDGSVFTDEMEKAIIRCPADKKHGSNQRYVFPEDTIINLHQIRAISKNRIINDLKCNASEYIMPNTAIDSLNSNIHKALLPYNINLKQCIEYKIMQLFAPEILFQLLFEVEEKETTLKHNELVINDLKSRIKQLENEKILLSRDKKAIDK